MTNLIQLRPKDFVSKEAIYLNAQSLHEINFFRGVKPLSQQEVKSSVQYLQLIEKNNGGVIYPALMQLMCQILDTKSNNQ